jgi:hypothetical protein
MRTGNPTKIVAYMQGLVEYLDEELARDGPEVYVLVTSDMQMVANSRSGAGLTLDAPGLSGAVAYATFEDAHAAQERWQAAYPQPALAVRVTARRAFFRTLREYYALQIAKRMAPVIAAKRGLSTKARVGIGAILGGLAFAAPTQIAACRHGAMVEAVTKPTLVEARLVVPAAEPAWARSDYQALLHELRIGDLADVLAPVPDPGV